MDNETLTSRIETSRTGRALVPVSPSEPLPLPRAPTNAAFLTQLIACARRLPDYRERRRTEPEQATARYGDTPRAARPRVVTTV